MTVEELEIIIKANIKDAIKNIKEVTNAVKQCVSDSIAPIKQISEQTKQVISANSNNIRNMNQKMNSYLNVTKSTSAQEELLIKKIREKYNLLQKLQNTQPIQLSDGRIATTSQKQLEVRAEIEKLESQLHKLQGTTEKTTEKSKNSFNNLWSSVKKGTLLLLGARSAFLLLREGMQSALQADESLQSQQEVTSNAIGQLFVPAMKVALDTVQYLVIGIALLIKMFTGYDALAKVTTRNIQQATKETKKFNKELTTMDEITNLNDESTGLGISSGLQSDLNALEEFNKKVEEVQKLFNNWGIQNIVDKLKDLWNWIVENKNALILLGATLGTVFAISKISSWLGNINQLIGGNGKGLIGFHSILSTIATIGIISVGVSLLYTGMTGRDIINDINEIRTNAKELEDSSKKLAESRLFYLNKTLEVLQEGNLSEEQRNTLLKNAEEEFGKLKQSMEEGVVFTEEQKNQIQEYYDILKDIDGYKANAEIEATVDAVMSQKSKNWWNNFVEAWEITANSFLGLFTGGKKISGARFATGGVLTKPTYGLMAEYSGASTNPEIISPQNIMYDTMLDAFGTILPSLQSQNQNGDIILNINGKELARATFSDYKAEEQRINNSPIIRRT